MHDKTRTTLAGEGSVASQPSPPSRPARRLFNPAELRLFRYTAILLSLVVLSALVGIIVWTFGWILNAFYNLLLPLAIAGILALVLHPVVNFLEARLRLSRLLAALLLLVVFFVSFGALIFFLVPILVSQIIQLMTVLPDILEGWQEHFSTHFPGISSMIADRMESSNGEESESGMSVAEGAGTTIMSYLGVLAGISFVPLFLFFTLLSGNSLRCKASGLLSIFHKPTQKKVLYFMDVFIGYVTAFFQGQLMIAVCMAALYSLGFTLIGLEFGMLSGMVLGLLNIVPFLGTLIGLLVILPMAYLQSDGGAELLLTASLVFAAVQLIESWLLTPKIMANRSGLHPALVIISLFFWGTALNGIIGMVLAVPLTAFFVAISSEIKASLKQVLSSHDAES